MSILDDIARRLRGGGCERLVKQTGNEVAITGASFGVGNYKIDIGNFTLTRIQFDLDYMASFKY